MIKIASVWKQTTNDGAEYYKGRLGNADLLIFHNKSTNPKSPEFDILVAKHEQYEAPKQNYSTASPLGTNFEDAPQEYPSEEPPF